MRSRLSRFAIPIALVVLGLALLAYSVIQNEAEIHWIFIIPVFTGTSISAFLGTILIIVGIFMFFFFYIKDLVVPYEEEVGEGEEARTGKATKTRQPASTQAQRQPYAQAPKPKKRFGGVVLVGPIPVIFGSDPKFTIIIVVLAIILIIVTLLFLLYFLTL